MSDPMMWRKENEQRRIVMTWLLCHLGADCWQDFSKRTQSSVQLDGGFLANVPLLEVGCEGC